MDFKTEFLGEARELLDKLEAICLKMERRGADDQLIGEAFRTAHTLKGSALSVEFHQLGQIAHKFEDYLDQVRKNKDQAAHVEVATLLYYYDLLSTVCDGLRLDHDFVLREMPLAPVSQAVQAAALPISSAANINAALSAPSQGPLRVTPISSSSGAVNGQSNTSGTLLPPALPSAEHPRRQAQMAPLGGTNAATTAAAAADAHRPSAHQDSDLHFRAFVRNMGVYKPEDQAWIYASLTRLAMPNVSCEKFAVNARQAFESHPYFRCVKRVCLVRRIGYANQLEVLSSDGDDTENLMPRGYRCFVAPGGSLFQLSSRAFRVFKSAQGIVDQYRDAGLPPQRSVFRIASMGYGSGLCIGIFAESKIIGLLFLNAKDDSLASISDAYLPVLTYLTALTHRFFLASGFGPLYHQVWGHGHESLTSAPYQANRLRTAWSFVGSALGLSAFQLTIEGQTELPSLIVHGHLAYLSACLALSIGAKGLAIKGTISDGDICFDCAFTGGAEGHAEVVHLKVNDGLAEALGFHQSATGHGTWRLRTPVEKLSSDPALRYSV